jgi:hypothetical protein
MGLSSFHVFFCVSCHAEQFFSFFLQARMTQESFLKLLRKIENHPVFSNNSFRPQAPCEWQLLVALAHFGLSGNGGSAHMLAQTFNISGKFSLLKPLFSISDLCLFVRGIN